MKFGKTKGTEGLLKLTNFGVATLIFVDIQPTTVSWEASETRPAGDALASSKCICVSSWMYVCTTDFRCCQLVQTNAMIAK